ncbi:tripartite tricarboxylate transporter substrate-binding protein [Bordetella petrii]|uniref:Exported protein n=1 Tax=Bordetella petrii (strain ATCC BAA-461 / DSM 12804 / CCUG 43448 / CIP 107267 / Se-1111R) TaxID=340100 RepID=A9IQU5_BORPD|nr:tripartite tricarboxylate transporter substrate-binding protein [Bordetella petrii]CAP43098.1 putative exported protein [Bordetella petrii]
MPDIPTLREQGLPDYDMAGWFAVVAPAHLPDADVRRVYQAFAQGFAAPEVKAAMATQGNTITLMPPDQTAAYFRTETQKYARIVQGAGIQRV